MKSPDKMMKNDQSEVKRKDGQEITEKEMEKVGGGMDLPYNDTLRYVEDLK